MKQKDPYNRGVLVFICFALFLLMWPWAVNAQNLARDIHVEPGPDSLDILVQLESPPFLVFDLGTAGVSELIFFNTRCSPRFEERILGGIGKFVELVTGQSNDLKLVIKREKIPRGLELAWMPDRNIYLIRLNFPKPEQNPMPISTRSVETRAIRFGSKKLFTRVVLELSGKPPWKVLWRDRLEIRIKNCAATVKKKKYRSLKGLKRIELRQQGSDLDLSLWPSKSPPTVRVFWLDIGNRLVTDIYDHAPDFVLGHVTLPADFGKPLIHDNTHPGLQKEKQRAVQEEQPKPSIPVAEPHPLASDLKKPVVVGKISKGINMSPPEYTKPGAPAVSPEEDLFYGRIVAAENFREYEKGLELISRFREHYPHSSMLEDLAFKEGYFYFQLLNRGDKGLLEATLSSYKNAIEKYPQSRKVPFAYLRMAQACKMGENFYDAVSYLNLLLDRFHDESILPSAYLERGRIYMKINLPDKAFQDFNTVIKKFPYSIECDAARFGIAQYLHTKGLYEEAEKWLNRVVENDPEYPVKNPEFCLLRAKNYLYLKEYVKARVLFFMALNMGEAGESPEEILVRIGDTYLFQGKKDLAKKIYGYVVTHYPGGEGVPIAELRLADFSSKMEAFEKIHEKYDNTPIGDLALLKLANVYYKNKAFEKVMETLEQIVLKPVKDEGGKAARNLFVRSCERAFQEYYKSGQFHKIIQLYKKYQEFLTENLSPLTRLLLASAYTKISEPQKAISIFKLINKGELSPKARDRYVIGLARAYYDAGKRHLAIKFLSENLKKIKAKGVRDKAFRDLGAYVLGIAETLERAGKRQQAVKFLSDNLKKIKAKDVRVKALLYLAELYRKDLRFYQALKIYEHLVGDGSLSNDSKTLAKVYCYMGQIYNKRRRPENAIKVLNESLAILEKDQQDNDMMVSALIELSKSYQTLGETAKAVAIIKKILGSGYGPDQPKYWDLKYMLAGLYQSQKMTNEAEAIYKEISDEGPPELQPRAQMQLGAINLERQLKNLSYWPDSGRRHKGSVVSR